MKGIEAVNWNDLMKTIYRGITPSYQGTLVRSSRSTRLLMFEYEIVLSLVELIPLSWPTLSAWHVSLTSGLMHVLSLLSSGCQTSLYSSSSSLGFTEDEPDDVGFNPIVIERLLSRSLWEAKRRSSAERDEFKRLFCWCFLSVIA